MDKEDDSFLQDFMERAKKRQEKLSQIQAAPIVIKEREDVSYPPLSPLPEEDSVEEKKYDRGQVDEGSVTEEKDLSPAMSELNYSSDLSLETDEVYRAEPVLCHSSPEHFIQQPRVLQERQPEHKPTSSHSLPSTSPNEQTLKEIQLQVDKAEQTRTQLKKVVEISKYGSKEHIEAARLLQIAELEHLNYTNQMALFKQGIRKKTESLGSIELTNIRLKISSKLRNDLAEEGVSHYFFCVASYGSEVKASEIIDTNDIRRQDLKAYLQFKERISFIDLPPDFIIKIEIFELVTGQHLPKLLYRLTPSKKTKMTLEPNFKRVGSMKLTIADRDVTQKNLVQWSKHEESKYIERECKFQIELKPEQLPTKAGMLHVRCLDNEGRPDWCRFWIDLSSNQIRFWTSKQDALDGKKPNQILELKDLCSEKTQKLTPDDDFYRQNSIVLYSFQQVAGGEKDTLFQRVLKNDPTYKLVKHQLGADNKEERDLWCSILDRSMHCFREWHGKTKVYSIEELKEMFMPY